jgi:hypothetical protein
MRDPSQLFLSGGTCAAPRRLFCIRHSFLLLWIGFVPLACLSEQAVSVPTNSAAIQQGAGHRFACTDYTQGKVFVVSRAGDIEWEYRTTSCNDLWVLPGGNLLFNTGHGVLEVSPEKRVVWSYDSPSEVYACQRLANGNTFVGECNAGRLLEITPQGKIAKQIRLLPEGQNGGHLYMRNARVLENGHYLVCHYGAEAVKEYDAEGKLLVTFSAPGGPHSAARLRGGHTLISCGDSRKDAKLLELDKEGTVVWSVSSADLPGISLKFLSGFHRLPNGNTVFSNWLGHGHFGEAPHLIEVTPDKKVVWTFCDHQHMKTVSSVAVLDGAYDAAKEAH